MKDSYESGGFAYVAPLLLQLEAIFTVLGLTIGTGEMAIRMYVFHQSEHDAFMDNITLAFPAVGVLLMILTVIGLVVDGRAHQKEVREESE